MVQAKPGYGLVPVEAVAILTAACTAGAADNEALPPCACTPPVTTAAAMARAFTPIDGEVPHAV